MRSITSSSIAVEFNADRHAEVWRLSAYLLENLLLSMQLKQMQVYDLKPADLLVFNLIAVASVQKSARSARALSCDTPDFTPSDCGNGSISARRIAEIADLPRTSVARSLARLKARSMVVERGRGQLQVPVGIILQGPFAVKSDELFAPVAGLFEQLVRLGVVRIYATETPAGDEVETGTSSIEQ